MTRRKYQPGDTVGPYNLKLIRYADDPANPRKPEAFFICPECGEPFRNRLDHVVSGRKKKCNTCVDQRIYEVGGRYGPANTLMLERHGVGKDIWKCSYCGKPFRADRYDIGSGHTVSCGCHRAQCSSERNTLDLSNQRFGRLVAIRIADELFDNREGCHIWECECDCGTKEVYVPTGRLTSGMTQSCGCLQRDRAVEANVLDLTGQKFDKLTAVRSLGKSKEGSCHLWECICECGNTVIKPTNYLTSPQHFHHCGCVTISAGEALISAILDELDIPYDPHWTNSHCINPETNAHFYFDFHLPDKHTLIEFDGQQHFEDRCQFGDPNCYQDTHRRDLAKNEWAEKHGFDLLRIPYTAYDELASDHALLLQWLGGTSSPDMPPYPGSKRTSSEPKT